MPPPSQRLLRRVPDVAALSLVAVALGALWRFFQVDQRPPMDLGHYFEALPGAWVALGVLNLSALLDHALHQGGLYNLSVALLARVFGRSPALLEGLEFLWLGVLFLAAWASARRLGGRWAGLAATALYTAMPVFHTGARCHWVHLPEASLVALAFWLWLREPLLEQRLTRVGLFLTLAMAFSLRPTALVFGLPVLLLAWRSARPRLRVLVPALSLAAAVLVLLPALPNYIAGKAMVREVYAEVVAPLGPSLVRQAFVLPSVAVVVGLLLLAAFARGRWREPALWLLSGWVLVGLGFCQFFHVGPDNFPLLFLGAALLAAQGLALPGAAAWMVWTRRALALGLVVVACLAMVTPMLLGHLAQPFVGVLGYGIVSLEPWSYIRPQLEVVTLDRVWPLLDEVCVRADETCTVLATRGLANLNREDDLSLAIFLSGHDGVIIHNAGQFFFEPDIESTDALEGLMVLDCPHAAPEPDNLFTERERALEAMVDELEVSFVYQLGAPLRCSFRVFRIEEADAEQALEEFWLNYPWRYSGPHTPPPPSARAAPR